MANKYAELNESADSHWQQGTLSNVEADEGDLVLVSPALLGTRQAPPLDLAPLEVADRSLVEWEADLPAGTGILIEVSLDGGATWLPATSGQPVPGLPQGTEV